jgi:CDGSH-type Zn-finger protein
MAITIKVRATGAYLIEGDRSEINLVDHEGNPIPIPEGKKNIALCRCGASTTKPFCDGTHSEVGFLAAEAAVRAEKPAG